MAKEIRKTLPTISVCIATYNSGKTLERCLKLIRQQDYPSNKIEILLGDGGSTDNTLAIAKKFKAKVLHVPSEKQHAEYNRGVAFNAAKGELALILDHDNFLPSRKWLKQMVEPLLVHKDVLASTTCYYHYDRKYLLLDRYFALFGTSEPLPYYLHKADRLRQYEKKWTLLGESEDCGKYYKVKFEHDPRKFPSIGSNGTLMRRELVIKHAHADADHHYPIDVLFDMVLEGYDTFAFVKNSVIHLTHSRGIVEFFKRRIRFVNKYHFEEQSKRRWSVVMKGDELNLGLYILYSLTLVKPTYDAFVGFLRIPDIAWFVHPFMCFGTTVIYGYATLMQMRKHKHIGI